MIRNTIIALILGSVIAAGSAHSQSSITAQAFAEVIEALTAQEMDQLNFGRFSPETAGGEVIISPDGSRSAQGTVILASGPHTPGRFAVTGHPEASFIIQLPETPSVLVHQETNKTMIVENWETDPPAGTETQILPDGSQFISVGAILVVGNIEDNPVGMYSGTFQLTFVYN